MIAAAPVWKLYGVPLSQPFRSVAWALLQNHVRFEIQLTVPGASSKIGSHHANYTAKSRMKTTKIPLLEDTRTGFSVAESPAILSFLCEHYGWEKTLYGKPGTPEKATIDSYMHWHHTGTRSLSAYMYPYLRDVQKDDSYFEKERARTLQTLQTLEEGWFSTHAAAATNNNNTVDFYIAGGDHPSIADLLAYEEIVQLTELGLLDEVQVVSQQFPKVFAWLGRMKQLPYYEEVHRSLVTLGDVTNTDEIGDPMSKRLGAATKAGLKALAEAQSEFPVEEAIPPASSKL